MNIARRPRGVGINCLVALEGGAWRNEYVDGWVDERTDGRTDGRALYNMCRWMDICGWTDGRTDGRIPWVLCGGGGGLCASLVFGLSRRAACG